MHSRIKYILGLFLVVISPTYLSGCATTIPKEALQLSPESLKIRQLQSRRFDADEKTLLGASASLLQDLGFNIDETSAETGVITCSKHRDATTTSQIVGAVFVALFTGVATPIDRDQLIRASLVTRPIHGDDKDQADLQTIVRVTFQRVVRSTQNQITRQEGIMDEEIYKEFFDKLAQSLFLEAHDI